MMPQSLELKSKAVLLSRQADHLQTSSKAQHTSIQMDWSVAQVKLRYHAEHIQ